MDIAIHFAPLSPSGPEVTEASCGFPRKFELPGCPQELEFSDHLEDTSSAVKFQAKGVLGCSGLLRLPHASTICLSVEDSS